MKIFKVLCIMALFLTLSACTLQQSYSAQIQEDVVSIPPEIFDEIEETPLEAMQRLLAERYDISPEAVLLTIQMEESGYIRGFVEYSVPDGVNGMFLGAETDDVWELVFDGEDEIPCEEILQYFTISQYMLPECYDII